MKLKRWIALLLVVVMALSVLPTAVWAEGGTDVTWTKVNLEDIQATDTIAITMTVETDYYVLPNTAIGGKKQPLASVTGTVSGDTLTTTDSTSVAWTITSTTGGYHIKNASGKYLYLTATNNGMRIGDTEIVWSVKNNYLSAVDSQNETRYLGVYDKTDWRCYTNTTRNIKDQNLNFWKLSTGVSEDGTPAKPTASVAAGAVAAGTKVTLSAADGVTIRYALDDSTLDATTGTEYVAGAEISIDADTTIRAIAVKDGKTSEVATFAYTIQTLVPISEALTATKGTFTVKGVVTFVDGKDVYIQDATGGICLTASSTPSDIKKGDTVVGVGSRGVSNGLPQLTGATITEESTDLLTLTATTKTIETAEICTYVTIENLTVTEVYDNNGQYSSPNITVEDENGKSIQIYKAVAGTKDANGYWPVLVGDKIKVTAAVGYYNKKQLRNTEAAEIVVTTPVATVLPEASVATGTAVEKDSTVELKAPREAKIYYTINGEEPTTSSTEYTGPITISADTTIKAIAVIGSGMPSAVQTFEYTIKTAPVVLMEELTEVPEHGDTVVIYYKTGGAAMGSAASGKKLAEVKIALQEGKLKLDDAMAQLDVTVDGANYIFTNAEGKYLTSAETGNGLSFADTLTDCGKWTLEASGDAWLVKNVGANFNGNYNQAMEYYNGFTTYGLKDSDIYKMDFFLADRDEIPDGNYVIYVPAYSKALSSVYDGFYNTGADMTIAADAASVEAPATEIWTVTNNDDENNTITISTQDGKKLSMGTSYQSTPLNDVHDTWQIVETGTTGQYYIKNVGRSAYLEWYNNQFSSYGTIGSGKEDLFTFRFVPATVKAPPAGPTFSDPVVLYNVGGAGVLGLQDDNTTAPNINNVAATLAEDKATVGNGGLIFTVSSHEDGGVTYYRFHNETHGYLASNGTGSNAFYTTTASNDADWELDVLGEGFRMKNRVAKYNGSSPQYLEFFGGSYKTYSYYAANKDGTDAKPIYTFRFLECANIADATGGVINKPVAVFADPMLPAYVGMDYTFDFTVDAVFGVQGELTVKVGDTPLTKGQDGKYTIPKALITGTELKVTVSGTDTKGKAISGSATVTVVNEPVISGLTPAAGSETGAYKRPTISATVTNAGENPTIDLKVNDQKVAHTYTGGVVSYTPAADMADGTVNVTLTVTRTDDVSTTKSWRFTVGEAQYQLYFGQLHSHTTYSDGSGSLDSALAYVKGLGEAENVDFVAFTDHSNYFDGSKVGGGVNPEGALYDMSLAAEASRNTWAGYKNAVAAFNAENNGKVAIAGFEMTWSGGPGHINTFNTPGIVSRNNTTLNNKTDDGGMKDYYALLSQPEGVNSISQFNHPGTTFGTFSDFAYWDSVVDTRIQLLEVGNGEGAIGSGGYFPSYAEYTKALDKGWHVSPTNNQDNHKGKWGNANDARDVILTDNFTEEGIYQAIRENKVYATEDKNLEIYYTANGSPMGARLDATTTSVEVEVVFSDPDATDSTKRVELVTNSGRVAQTWEDATVLAQGTVTATLTVAKGNYFYVRLTQNDGDIAVTSPVWIGEPLKLGVSAVESSTNMPVTNEALTLTTTLFNSEATSATIKSLTMTVGGENVPVTLTNPTLAAGGTMAIAVPYTPTQAKVLTVEVKAELEQGGQTHTSTATTTLDVQNADKLVYIGIDASHFNEYVAGNYKDNMGNFSKLAVDYAIRTVELDTSEALIAACSNAKYKALILTAPSRRDGDALRDPYKCYTQDEINAIAAFNAAGGMVILAGWSDFYEHYTTFPAADHMAAQQNLILEALGSSLRINDDATYDNSYNGGQEYRLYFNTYGDSFLTERVEVDPDHPHDRMYTEVFSQYGGASIYVDGSATIPATVTPVVFGHSTTYSMDRDNDSLGGDTVPKYEYATGDKRLMVMATEELPGKGLIVVSGAAFMSNFEVQAELDNNAEKNYSNYKICENLLQKLNPIVISDIADVQAEPQEGVKFVIEGVVTSNASGYDPETAFFDCIYVQDATGGINAFPVAGSYKIGDKVRISGTTSSYQDERQIAVTSISLLGTDTVPTPKEVTATQINDGSVLGSLVTLKGVVVSFTESNGAVENIVVQDAAGVQTRVFIDGYITSTKTISGLEVGCNITATGLASHDTSFAGPAPRIRIRDRADIVCTEGSGLPVIPSTPTVPGVPGGVLPPPVIDDLPFHDVATRDWFYGDVKFVYQYGLMNGVGGYRFAPNDKLTRAMLVTILYRMEDEPFVTYDATFTDVANYQWYTQAVEWAVDNDIVFGIGGGKFAPHAPITREQLAAILYRYAQFKGYDVSLGQTTSLLGFKDVGSVSSYAVTAMKWAVGEDIIGGANGCLMPRDNATRAQVAAMIHRFLEG